MRGAREAPAPRDSLNFRRASLLSRNEFEIGTFTIVLHATSSFTYVSVIYGANFPHLKRSVVASFLTFSGRVCTFTPAGSEMVAVGVVAGSWLLPNVTTSVAFRVPSRNNSLDSTLLTVLPILYNLGTKGVLTSIVDVLHTLCAQRFFFILTTE